MELAEFELLGVMVTTILIAPSAVVAVATVADEVAAPDVPVVTEKAPVVCAASKPLYSRPIREERMSGAVISPIWSSRTKSPPRAVPPVGLVEAATLAPVSSDRRCAALSPSAFSAKSQP